jgi:hypothetical protein
MFRHLARGLRGLPNRPAVPSINQRTDPESRVPPPCSPGKTRQAQCQSGRPTSIRERHETSPPDCGARVPEPFSLLPPSEPPVGFSPTTSFLVRVFLLLLRGSVQSLHERISKRWIDVPAAIVLGQHATSERHRSSSTVACMAGWPQRQEPFDRCADTGHTKGKNEKEHGPMLLLAGPIEALLGAQTAHVTANQRTRG